MKFKKKTAMLVSFTLGTLLVATTALADIANKSGYDQLKDTLKVTAEQSSEKFDSYTMDYSTELKDNGKTLTTTNAVKKYDRNKNASENMNSSSSGDQNEAKYYSYIDKTSLTSWQDNDPTYNVTQWVKGSKEESASNVFPNPFKQDNAADFEKIADAVVGSLKDHVVVTENSDGSKGLAGSLTEVQIPSLVNAVASLQFKQYFNGQRDNMPHLTKDVFVKEVKGTAKVNQNGVMESVIGTAILSGKDDKGTVHELTLEILVKLTNINSTTVTKPDVTGKKVVTNVANNGNPGTEITNPEKFVGKFKNDILIEKDKKFVKVGERFIDITQFDNKTIAGRYYEVYKTGYEEYAKNKLDFKFEGKKPEQKNGGGFDITTESGRNGNIYLERLGKIQFYVNGPSMNDKFDGGFSPDLD